MCVCPSEGIGGLLKRCALVEDDAASIVGMKHTKTITEKFGCEIHFHPADYLRRTLTLYASMLQFCASLQAVAANCHV
jgi:hypothetical protein